MKAYELFKRRTLEDRIHFGPAVVQHIYDKAMKPMFEIFTETIYKHNPDQDMSQIKESKISITRKKLSGLIIEAMFDPRAAREKAKFRAKTSIPGNKMSVLADMLDSEDEETAIQGHSFLDTLGDYDSPTGDSYQDIKDFDQQMDDATAEIRKARALDDWEKYMVAAGPEVRSVVNKLTQPGVDLYVVSLDDDTTFRAPGEEVVRRPENFHLMAISSPDYFTEYFSFADEIGDIMGIDFEGDDMDAILIFLEKLAGDNNIGHVPAGYEFSPEDAFMVWITQNNPNLKIYVDP